jgi:hypothetical protein
VKRILWRRVPQALLLTLLFVSLLLFGRLPREPVVQGYLLAIGAIAALVALAIARLAQGPAQPSQFERALRRPRHRDTRPEALRRYERHVPLACESAFDLHFRLRPELVEIASGQLWTRHGIDLESRPERAREVLPPEVWELVRPDRPPPADRRAPGISRVDLASVVAALEAI